MLRKFYQDIESLSQGLAHFTETTLQNALARKQQVTLVVPGGNTPSYYFPELAKCKLTWNNIIVTLSDERWVDVNSDESNEHLVRQKLMNYLPLSTRFVGLKTNYDNPFSAVSEIHQRLDSLPLPLSLAILGLGEDGHIASLFPGMNLDLVSSCHCIAVEPPIAPSPRVSLSLPILTESEQIAVVVIGQAKRQLLDSLSNHPNSQLPLVWLLQHCSVKVTVFEADNL